MLGVLMQYYAVLLLLLPRRTSISWPGLGSVPILPYCGPALNGRGAGSQLLASTLLLLSQLPIHGVSMHVSQFGMII